MAERPQYGIADGQSPAYTYVPNRGYVKIQNGSGIQAAKRSFQDDEQHEWDEDLDDILDDGDNDEMDTERLMAANPADLTKSYNRQHGKNYNSQQLGPGYDIQSKDDQISVLTKHAAKLRIEEKYAGTYHSRGADKSERATAEQVLDPRTRMILLQMINRNIVSEINGVISTGKEANVYHALTVDDEGRELHRAIKVYKTSILVFKDREKYVAGEFRFKQGYNKSSNRAMVKVWAEKEMRNLKRIHAAGIPSPEPLYLRLHVLGMSFVGNAKGISAPRLKDVEFVEDAGARWRGLYVEIVANMRVMYQECRLVHADLSEYNILYHDDKAYIIDVSQSVEHDHPRSLDFLRMDIKNVNDFFKRKDVAVLADRLSSVRAEVDSLMAQRDDQGSEDNEVDNEVFRKQYIPQTLNEVYDAERDIDRIKTEGRDALVYKDLLAPAATSQNGPADLHREGDGDDDGDNDGEDQGVRLAEESEEEDDDDDDESMSESNSDKAAHQPRGKRFQDREEKKAHKQKVKEEKREKRLTKMPKQMKKRLVKEKSKTKR
ncbi:hypothetical protein DV736_g1238, partial [Chaetothyriales sp. CBS 134916]